MPLIQKPNYNQIFASQAPDIDKPAGFNNYPEGWGPESRPNNGKPTIRGFNYLQQTSDLKDLWILQNGACLPYDESIEYAEGAPVLKDGVIQYKTADGFSPVFSKKPYILKYFSEGTSYPLNARIMLDSGDIVKSTIANNTVNPNVDMTGWLYDSPEKLDKINHLQYSPYISGEVSSADFIEATANKRNIAENSSDIRLSSEAVFSGESFLFDGNDSVLQTVGTGRLISVDNNTNSNDVAMDIRNTNFTQEWNPDEGSGGSNNNSVIYSRGVENPKILLNKFSASMGLTTTSHYTDDLNISYKTKFAKIAFNHFKDQQKQCIETFGSDHNIVVGNGGDIPLLNSNAIRITGSERVNELGDYSLNNTCSVFAANTFSGGQGTVGGLKYSASVSVQTRVYGASVVAQAAHGFQNAVNVKGGSSLANQSRSNYIQATAVDCNYAVRVEGARSTSVDITAYNYKNRGIQEHNPSSGTISGAMKYSGLLVAGVDTTDQSVFTLSDGNQFNLLIDLRDGGATRRGTISGKNQSGVISVIGSDDGALNLNCSNSNLQITILDVDSSSVSKIAFRIYGSNNTITFNTQGNVRLESNASGNVILGNAGRVTAAVGASDNIFIGKAAVFGFSGTSNTHVNPSPTSVVYDPSVIAPNSSVTTTVTVTGVVLGNIVQAAFNQYHADIEISAIVSAANTVAVKFKNTGATTVDLESGTITVKKI